MIHYWKPLSAFYKNWNNDKHVTISQWHMGLWTQAPRPMWSMLGKLLATPVASKYSPLYAIHFQCCFTHVLKKALYQSWLYFEMMFAVAEHNSGRDEYQRPFNCDLTLRYTSKSNVARYVEYGQWSTLPNPRTSSCNNMDATVWGGELFWWRR